MIRVWQLISIQILHLQLKKENCLVTLNASKTKLVTVHHHRVNLKFLPIVMDGCSLMEVSCRKRLLGPQVELIHMIRG